MFQFQFEFTLEDMDTFSRMMAKTYRRKKVLIYRVVLALLAVAYLVMGGLLLFVGRTVFGLFMIVGGVFFATRFLFYHRWVARRAIRGMKEGSVGTTVTLEEERIHDKDEKMESVYPYGSIDNGYHYRDRYFLFLDKRRALILPERGLTQGDLGCLKKFLEDKIGKEIVEL